MILIISLVEEMFGWILKRFSRRILFKTKDSFLLFYFSFFIEWNQVSLYLQEPSKYHCQSQHCCGLAILNSSSELQFPSSLSRVFWIVFSALTIICTTVTFIFPIFLSSPVGYLSSFSLSFGFTVWYGTTKSPSWQVLLSLFANTKWSLLAKICLYLKLIGNFIQIVFWTDSGLYTICQYG